MCRKLGLLLAVMVLPALALAGETEAPAEGETDATDAVFSPEVEALLRDTSDPEAYTEMERCIQTRSIRDTQILDERHVVFEMPSKKFYLVQFKHRCHRLRPNSTLVYETRHSQLCRLDQVRAANSLSMGDVGPPCSIPGFIPVQPEQIALLKESLKAQRQAEIQALEAEKAEQRETRTPGSEDT